VEEENSAEQLSRRGRERCLRTCPRREEGGEALISAVAGFSLRLENLRFLLEGSSQRDLAISRS